MRRHVVPWIESDDEEPLPSVYTDQPPEINHVSPEAPSNQPDLVISFRWDGFDTFWVLTLLFFSLFTRFWVIYSPREVVSSENSTRTILECYHNRNFFLDIEPELSHIVTYFIASAMEYQPNFLSNITNDGLYASAFYTSVRSISAFCAAIVVPCTFLTIRTFGGTLFSAACGGLFALVEPSLISPARFINATGMIQLLCALSLLFAALSQHFAIDCVYQSTFVILQGVAASAAFCSTFNSFPYLLFAIFWPLYRFRSVKQSQIIVCSVVILYFLTEFCHVICAPKIPREISYISQDLKDTLSLRHFFLSLSRMFGHFWQWGNATVENFKIERVVRRLFLCEKWTVLWEREGRYAVSFTNRIFGIPAVAIGWFDVLILNSVLSEFFLVALILTGFGFQEEGCCDAYLVEVIALVSTPLAIERLLPPSVRGAVVTTLICLSILAFVDWAPLIYAYENPLPFLPPHLPTQINESSQI